MNKLPILLLLFSQLITSDNQAQGKYPAGVSIDPAIKQKMPDIKKSSLGNGDAQFKVVQFINDTAVKGGFFSGDLQLTAMVMLDKTTHDTVITFINMLIPYGVQLTVKDGKWTAETFVSSRNCKCFKSKLSDKLGYGAGAEPDSLTLVLNKGTGFKKGEMIYGYLKIIGGKMYHFGNENEQGQYETYRFNYEGYFEVKFEVLGGD